MLCCIGDYFWFGSLFSNSNIDTTKKTHSFVVRVWVDWIHWILYMVACILWKFENNSHANSENSYKHGINIQKTRDSFSIEGAIWKGIATIVVHIEQYQFVCTQLMTTLIICALARYRLNQSEKNSFIELFGIISRGSSKSPVCFIFLLCFVWLFDNSCKFI